MKASEIVYEILGDIRKANEVLSKNRVLTADDMLSLTGIYQHILEYDRYPEYLVSQLKLESTNNKALEQLFLQVITECNTYIEMYDLSEEEWDRQCDFDNLMNIIGDKADREYGLKIKIAKDEISKALQIFDKYNDITRLYNSLDCRNDKEEYEQILEKYRVELENLIGRPVKLETINEEHDDAYSSLKEKKKELDELSKNVLNYKTDILKQINDNPILDIYDYCQGLHEAFIPSHKDNKGNNKRGRPRVEETQKKNGITDLASCFQSTDYYNKFISAIYKEGPIQVQEANDLYLVLHQKGWIKQSIKVERFAEKLLEEMGEKMHFSTPASIYLKEPEPRFIGKWENLLNG